MFFLGCIVVFFGGKRQGFLFLPGHLHWFFGQKALGVPTHAWAVLENPPWGKAMRWGSRSFVPVFFWYFVELKIKKDQQDINKMFINSLYIYMYTVYYNDIEHNIEDNTITYHYIEYL